MANVESRVVEFGMHPKPGRNQRGAGITLEGDDLKRHLSYTRVPMRAVQVPIAVSTLSPDELHTWTVQDILFGCNRHGGQIEPIHIWPIELC